MGKTIIVTSGPTNEKIDDVMKITNMSTGRLGAIITDRLLEIAEDGEIDKIYYVHSKLAAAPSVKSDKIHDVIVESTDDLLNTLRVLLRNRDEPIHAVVHSVAVGDYKGRYVARAEDLADEIAGQVAEAMQDSDPMDENKIRNIVTWALTHPSCGQDRDAKISSYEPNLMVMLDLTPKVIGQIKKWSPGTMLVGFKLLDHVSKDELFQVADRLRIKNAADYIVANDLSKIGDGKHWAMIVGKDGIVKECETKLGIADAIAGLVL